MPGRPYEKRRRADAQELTRRRITEATVSLHEELGPARTTVCAIAERAGVSRVTVYNHFGDDAALYAACSAAYDAAHPAPEPAGWRAIDDPGERLRIGLAELYGYYAANERMLANVLRDRDLVPALDELHRSTTDPWLEEAVDALAAGRRARGRAAAELRALLRLLVDFWSWRRLSASGLTPERAATLAAGLLAG